MKALANFENKDKLRLLHDLFPLEIPVLLDDIMEFCKDFRENKEAYAKNWSNGFMPIAYWLKLSEETETLINKYRRDMERSSKVFSDQLSFTYAVLFVNDRIIKYADNESENYKFKVAVDLLFKADK